MNNQKRIFALIGVAKASLNTLQLVLTVILKQGLDKQLLNTLMWNVIMYRLETWSRCCKTGGILNTVWKKMDKAK